MLAVADQEPRVASDALGEADGEGTADASSDWVAVFDLLDAGPPPHAVSATIRLAAGATTRHRVEGWRRPWIIRVGTRDLDYTPGPPAEKVWATW